MEHLLRTAVMKWRNLGVRRSPVEKALVASYRGLKARLENTRRGPHNIVFSSGDPDGQRVGIQLMGGCDTESTFDARHLIQQNHQGTFVIRNDGLADWTRSDILLQTLDGVPETVAAQILDHMPIDGAYFTPRLFDPWIVPEGIRDAGRFPKNVVVLSIGPDLVRSAYRHKATGVVVDPGGLWFNRSVEEALLDRTSLAWFKEHFAPLGRNSVEVYEENLRRLVMGVRRRTNAKIVLYTMVSVEPRTRRHSYAFLRDPIGVRLRTFNLAAQAMADELGVGLVDMDRLVKRTGIVDQADIASNTWGVYPPSLRGPTADETYRVMRQMGVFAD